VKCTGLASRSATTSREAHGGTIEVDRVPVNHRFTSCLAAQSGFQTRVSLTRWLLLNLARLIRLKCSRCPASDYCWVRCYSRPRTDAGADPRSWLARKASCRPVLRDRLPSGVLWSRLWALSSNCGRAFGAREIDANAWSQPVATAVVSVSMAHGRMEKLDRNVMKMAPVETAHPLKVCAIALITFVVR